MSTPWEIAKELLKEDIIPGYVTPTMKPVEAHDLCIEYQCIIYNNFRSNLLHLWKVLGKQSNAAIEDDAAVAHD